MFGYMYKYAPDDGSLSSDHASDRMCPWFAKDRTADHFSLDSALGGVLTISTNLGRRRMYGGDFPGS